jgi:hypothetical protein
MSKLHGRDLLEEMQWRYAGGPLPTHRRRRQERAIFRGCVVRFTIGLLFCACVILLVRWLLS